MRYDAEHKARTRARVLTEASAEILTHGCERVGLAAIMARAGLTHGGFYAHFRSKDDLLSEAIGHIFEDRFATHFARVDSEPPAVALAGFIATYVSMSHRDNLERGCPIPVLAGEVGRLSPTARDRFAQGVDRLIDWLAHRLDCDGHADPRALAASILSEAVGAISLARAQPDPTRAEDILCGARGALHRRLRLPALADA